MGLTIQNGPAYLNFNTVIEYAFKGYHRCVTWITSNGSLIYSKLPVIRDLATQHMTHSFKVGTTFLWSHKTLIISGMFIGIALWKIVNFWKNRPQFPKVEMESSLDVAKLTIAMPKEEKLPLNVTLTFCIDTSSSMNDEDRLLSVKRAVNDVLDSAQKIVNRSKEANIEIAIVEFNDSSKVITLPTKITPTNRNAKMSSVVSTVKKQLEQLNANGGTRIIEGLETSTQELEKIAKENQSGSHTFIILTDGGDNLQAEQLSSIQSRLLSLQAKLFAIGIGRGHSKKTLEQIVASKNGDFKGTYIDTTLGEESIESAISKIYTQAIASFNHLELTTEQLKPGTWSVNNRFSIEKGGRSGIVLGSLAEGENLTHVITIHSLLLTEPIDLANVTFSLGFNDPKGRQGALSLRWKPNTIIKPEIVKLG